MRKREVFLMASQNHHFRLQLKDEDQDHYRLTVSRCIYFMNFIQSLLKLKSFQSF